MYVAYAARGSLQAFQATLLFLYFYKMKYYGEELSDLCLSVQGWTYPVKSAAIQRTTLPLLRTIFGNRIDPSIYFIDAIIYTILKLSLELYLPEHLLHRRYLSISTMSELTSIHHHRTTLHTGISEPTSSFLRSSSFISTDANPCGIRLYRHQFLFRAMAFDSSNHFCLDRIRTLSDGHHPY